MRTYCSYMLMFGAVAIMITIIIVASIGLARQSVAPTLAPTLAPSMAPTDAIASFAAMNQTRLRMRLA